MDKWKGKVAIVTGASSGIGEAIAKILVKHGLHVAGLARRIDRLEALEKSLKGESGKFFPLKCDVSKEEEVLECFKHIDENIGSINILVNNAGLVRNTTLVDGETDDWRAIMDVNFMACCVCCREAVKYMNKAEIDGHIIFINSVIGHRVPEIGDATVINVYASSKFALRAYADSLRIELRNRKSAIKTTSISPGIVQTEIQNSLSEELKEFSKMMPYLKPEDVADAVVYALSTAPHIQIQDVVIKPLGEMF